MTMWRQVPAGTWSRGRRGLLLWTFTIVCVLSLSPCFAEGMNEHQQNFTVKEEEPPNTPVGTVGINDLAVVAPFEKVQNSGSNDGVSESFNINLSNGVITTKRPLDREKRSTYTFYLTMPKKPFDAVKVEIKLIDINDNSPSFPNNTRVMDIPESAPVDMKIPLGSVTDPDLGTNGLQKCEIVSGNTENAFRLKTKPPGSGSFDLLLDLLINKKLDYETTSFYSLIIRATDGGGRTGDLRVKITINDQNDHQPTFNQSRYSARIPENATIGTSVLQVYATDEDKGENGKVSYYLDPTDPDQHFVVNPVSGVVTVNKPLDYETKSEYKLAIYARDNGSNSQPASAALDIELENINELPANINLTFLQSGNKTGKIPENIVAGTYVARVSISDPDNNEVGIVNVTLLGGEGIFGLETRNDLVYLVIISQPPDREVKPYYNLTIIATDLGTPPLHASRAFTIWIEDINDNDPVFTKNVYYAEINEAAESGTSVTQVKANDPDDGDNARIRYSIADTPQASWFQIDQNTGLITTKSGIDCEIDSKPVLIVYASDEGKEPRSANASVVINVKDVNDKQPEFDQSFYSVKIPEDKKVQSCILTVSAVDPECGTNAPVTYAIVQGFDQPLEFEINNITGQICIIKSLDYEKSPTYNFLVQASDRDGLSTTAPVRVILTDVNDNSPIFDPVTYKMNVEEGMEIGSLRTVNAKDADSGDIGTVQYSIESGNNQGFFSIDPSNGEVSLIKVLPLGKRVYNLIIQATDGGGRTAVNQAHMTISVIDANMHPAKFSQHVYNFSISEGVTVKTPVGEVKARSPNSSPVKYSILSGAKGWFTINQSTGEVLTSDNIDREQHLSILLFIQAETGNPPVYSTAQVNITIFDINDNTPHFTIIGDKLEISEREDREKLSVIYIAEANDKDNERNGSVRYRLENNQNQMFQIEPLSGEIRLQKTLDYEKQQKYEINIVAYDQGVPESRSSTMTLVVKVKDVNDNPPVFSKEVYDFDVVENISLNSKVANVTATDLDSDENGRVYYMFRNSKYTSVFGINPPDGFIYIKKKIDRESQDLYIMVVVASDHGKIPGKLTSTATVRINVKDVSDNDPIFTSSSYHFTVKENLQIGSTVGHISATDQDTGQNAELMYRFENPVNKFVINPLNGEITTIQVLDREETSDYNFTVEVSDKGTPPRSARTSVKIFVLDDNDNSPLFDPHKTYIGRVDENKSKGTKVLKVTATDPDADENGSVSYWLDNARTDQAGVRNFAIHPSSGWITTKEVLDYETQSEYKLKIIARDGGSPARETLQTVTVMVNDDNDEAPLFHAKNMTLRVVENTPVGTPVGRVTAYDKDSGENGRVSYYLVSGNVFSLFNVDRDTGEITSIRQIDYEESSSHVLGIKAVDNNVLYPKSSNISVTIMVIDVNDNAPVFEQDPVVLRTVKENTPSGYAVYTFTATDKDSKENGTVQYHIAKESTSGPDPGTGPYFFIDQDSGQLKIGANIDYEKVHQILLIIEARDTCPYPDYVLSASVTTIVYVIDVNDNYPIFQSRTQVHIFEDEPVGFPILYIIAVDKDYNENNSGNNLVSYSIMSGNERGKFLLDSTTGLLKVSSGLDREEQSRYFLNISAQDHGEPKRVSYKLLNVFVEDINDNAPHFGNSTYHAQVVEHSKADQVITTLSATDDDIGQNGNLTYLIPKGIAEDKFTVDRVHGVVRTTKSLDREEKSSYIITVYVRDGGYPTQYDMATLLIEVEDVNDNPPVFKSKMYTFKIPENRHQSNIFAFTAYDADAGQNAKVRYSITGGNDGHFSIDESSGELSCTGLDRESVDIYNLTITAQDEGSPVMSGHCLAYIYVLDENDNDPQFTKSFYTKSLQENVPKGETVLQVSASDPDQGHNGEVTYALGNDTEGFFSVNSTSGEIITTGIFDREKKAIYVFDIMAIDGGISGPRNHTAQVKIRLLDVNDNAPTFIKVPYRKTVPQNTASGTEILQVHATDPDLGLNGEVVFSLDQASPGRDLFQISSDGRITAKQDLSSSVGYHNVQVLARDRGTPVQSSTGVIEILVGPDSSPSLEFTQEEYTTIIKEHSKNGSFVKQVRVKGLVSVSYSFASGNEDRIFEINQASGNVRVANSRLVDYERSSKLKLIVSAKANGKFAYATLWVSLTDINDNSPKFAQTRYFSAIWENNKPETFVTMIQARDVDTGQNGYVTYSIINGNDGEPFVIDPPHTGIIKTNINFPPLDREITESYRLVIEAIDHGNPPKSSTCTLRINVNDENDNQPYFPKVQPIHISERLKVGCHVTTVTASDVDSDPTLIYDFSMDGNPENTFNIDRFSGSISLAKSVDHERRNHYVVEIKVSDGKHSALTQVDVYIDDENDNAPEFSQQSYQIALPELTPPNHPVISVNATDADSGRNSRITYSMGVVSGDAFYINSTTGTVYTKKVLSSQSSDSIIQLVVTAEDGGDPPLSTMVAIHIQVTDINKYAPVFLQSNYVANISESRKKGDSVTQVSAIDQDHTHRTDNINYKLIEDTGDDAASIFQIRRKTGEIFLTGQVDRENKPLYKLTVMAKDRGSPPKSTKAFVTVHIQDENDNPPRFHQPDGVYRIELNESYPSEHVFLYVIADDDDEGPHAEIQYTITSGNNEGIFFIHGNTGGLFIMPGAHLDYETHTSHRLIVRAVDCTKCLPKLSAFVTVEINVTDVNEYPPVFPISPLVECIYENSKPGSTVFQAQANDGDGGVMGSLRYSIIEKHKDSAYFSIDPNNGYVLTQVMFDYEVRTKYGLRIMAVDSGNNFTEVDVVINILDVDEYPPVFPKETYSFSVPGSAKKGDYVGQVNATDKDGGTAGRIIFGFKYPGNYFEINATSGTITVKTTLHDDAPVSGRKKRALTGDSKTLIIQVSSGMEGSQSATARVVVNIDRTCDGCVYVPQTNDKGLPVYGLVIIIIICILVVVVAVILIFLFVRRHRQKSLPPKTSVDGESPFDHLDPPPPFVPQRNGVPLAFKDDMLQYGPNASNVTSSDISDQSHNSASSGRGSAEEEEEDEEIRMINANTLRDSSQGYLRRKTMPDSGIQQDDDTLSEPSVQTHQEYLARLGIDTSKIGKPKPKQPINHSVESMHQFSDEGGGEGNFDMGHSDCGKLTDIETDEEVAMIDRNKDLGFHEPEAQHAGSLSSVINSEEEYSGSYNWDYLLNWGPQYQPLAHVFAEIAKLKDDSIQPKKQPIRTVPQRNLNSNLHPKPKTVPPPIITNAPPKAVALQVVHRPSHTSSGSSSHGNSARASTMNTSLPSLPRSPISYDSSFTSPALTPSFTPSLSPLGTGSPSPVVSAHTNSSPHSSGHNTPGKVVSKQNGRLALSASSESEQEFRI